MPVAAEANQQARKWACITVHPSLPSKAVQLAGARAWAGYSSINASQIYADDVSEVGRTTRWEGKLPKRETLMAELAAQPGSRNQVYFRSPLCVGFSEKHAADTLAKIFAHDALVFVQSEAVLYRRGDDLTDLLDAVAREAKAATQRRYRASSKVGV